MAGDIIRIVEEQPHIIKLTAPGPQGPPGAAGSPGLMSAIAGNDIVAFQVVVLLGGFVYVADPTNILHLGHTAGIASTSASTNNPVTVSIYGELTGFPNNLIPGQKYSVGANGVLTPTPVGFGFVWQKIIGIAKTSTTFLLGFGPDIEVS